HRGAAGARRSRVRRRHAAYPGRHSPSRRAARRRAGRRGRCRRAGGRGHAPEERGSSENATSARKCSAVSPHRCSPLAGRISWWGCGAMTFATVIYEVVDGVAWVTLNRPQVLNAYSVQMRDDLAEVLAAVRDDSEVRVLVLRGAGRAFCAGADLTEFGTAPSPT